VVGPVVAREVASQVGDGEVARIIGAALETGTTWSMRGESRISGRWDLLGLAVPENRLQRVVPWLADIRHHCSYLAPGQVR
jgi:hypothetical protein